MTKQPDSVFIGPVSKAACQWADCVVALRDHHIADFKPYPPQMDGDLLWELPYRGEDALNQAGYWLDSETVYTHTYPLYGIGIRHIVKSIM